MDKHKVAAFLVGGVVLYLGERLAWYGLSVVLGPDSLIMPSGQSGDPAGLILVGLALPVIAAGLLAAAGIAGRPLSAGLIGFAPLGVSMWFAINSSTLPWDLLGIAGALALVVCLRDDPEATV